MKLSFVIITISVILLANSFAQNSFGSGDYDSLHQWGSFGATEPSHFAYPQFVGVSDDGSIFVSDFGNKRIQKFSSSGEYITDWGNSGKQLGSFYNPSGIAVDGDFVFVADRDLNRIQKFSLDGEFVTSWGKQGTSEGQFMYPAGIDAHNGLVYVIDTGNQRIQIFSSNGDFVSSFGSSGLGPGQFLNPVGIDIDNDGNIYVTDKGNHTIEKFNSDGEFMKSFPFYYNNYVFSPEAIAVDPLGKMFVVNSADGKLLHLSQDANLLLSKSDQLGPYYVSFKDITDIEIGINGELLVIDSPTHSIQSFETEFYEEPLTPYFVAPEIDEHISYDQTKPVIIAPPSFEVEAEDFLTEIFVGTATATDDSGIKIIINNAPDAYPPGITNLIWIAFDNAGHNSNTSQRITVNTCGNNYSSYNLIKGTPGDDVIYGTDGDDLIFGLEGNDLISGGLGNDCIFGGSGDDIISGNDGDDTIKGNSGNDILKGQSGIDIIHANSGSDVIDGGADSDRCYLDSEKDLLINCE
ncbi:MAG: 6-bladed beta-propeller [Nitrosopumilus sp.]|nr:6-bladed beta-propeller [Nitrosopumilus sp.]MBL7018805.1 6-bladed beta-propeller [Nitrosopumilus sp.]